MRTYLELDDPAGLRPAGPPRVEDVEVERVAPPDGALSRWLYAEVGRDYQWTDHLGALRRRVAGVGRRRRDLGGDRRAETAPATTS